MILSLAFMIPSILGLIYTELICRKIDLDNFREIGYTIFFITPILNIFCFFYFMYLYHWKYR